MPEQKPPRLIVDPVTTCDCEGYMPLHRLKKATPEVQNLMLLQEQARVLLPVMARFPGCLYIISPWQIDEANTKLMQEANKTLVNAAPMYCRIVAYTPVRLKVPEALAGAVNQEQADYLCSFADRLAVFSEELAGELRNVGKQWLNNGEPEEGDCL